MFLQGFFVTQSGELFSEVVMVEDHGLWSIRSRVGHDGLLMGLAM
jgi:hypothetical protein